MQSPLQAIDLTTSRDQSFVEDVARESGQDLRSCYQCGNCTAGCAYTMNYDIPVHQIMRLVQLGLRDKALSCRSIWLCASCHTCSCRCPAEIDPAAHMEALRQMSRRAGTAAEPSSRVFADAFLATLKRNGRMYELEFMMRYNLASGRPFTDADLAPVAISRGKLHIMPPKVAGRDAVARIVERFEKERDA